ncbi:MAG: polysaccharide biosynthesis C-terminal domain-containing protein [Kofleriaceae bacterium]|nr:polysaccharide biosynthesis C-terminal domain-containing protein [Kofleriaceae bacterium]MCL4228020.1 polysaccharide biosynthesis C-terminal domain-containing protein [Myxococcales bacterium]
MSDRAAQRKKDAKDAAIYVAARSLAGMLFLITYVIALHRYTELEFQYVAAVLLVYESAIALGSLGLPDAVFYFIGKTPERAAAIVRQVSALLLGASFPVIAIAAVAAIAMSDDNVDLVAAIPWLAAVILVELPTQPAVNQLIAHGYAGTASALFFGFAVLRTGAVLLPLVTPVSITIIPPVMAVLGLTRLAAHVIILWRLYPLPPGERWFDKVSLKTIMLWAIPAGMAATVGKINPQIDKYTVKLMLGGEVFTHYTAAALEIPLVTMIPYAIGAVMQVRYVRLFAQGDVGELRALWYHNVEKTIAVVLPLAILLIVTAPEVVLLLASEKHAHGATVPFQIFTIVLLHRVAAYGSMLQATNQTPVLVKTSLLILGSNLILTVPCTLAFGAYGAAIATVIANVPAWLLTLDRIGRAMGGTARDALPWRFYLRALALTAALGGALWLVRPHVALGAGMRLLVMSIGFMAVYLVAARLARILTTDDLRLVRRWLTLGVWK